MMAVQPAMTLADCAIGVPYEVEQAFRKALDAGYAVADFDSFDGSRTYWYGGGLYRTFYPPLGAADMTAWALGEGLYLANWLGARNATEVAYVVSGTFMQATAHCDPWPVAKVFLPVVTSLQEKGGGDAE